MATPYAQINQDVSTLPPLLRSTTTRGRTYYRLSNGARGSLQTAQVMANLVREDAVKNKKLEMLAAQILISNGLDSHSDAYEIADCLLRYVQRLTYIHDPAGSFDSVQSAEQVIREQKGDCDDLSVLLATLLAMVGLKPRFVMARYKETSEGFDHVYVDVELARGRVALDPTSRKHGIGWESPRALERVAYPIFDGKVVGLGEVAARLKGYFGRDAETRRHGDAETLNGFGDCSAGCQASAQGREVINGVTLGSNTLSLPAILFGSGAVIVSLKAMDYVLRVAFGER